MKNILALATVFLFFQTLGAMPLKNEERAATTCGDPNTAVDIYEGYSPKNTAHVIHERWAFVKTVTDGADFQLQGKVGRAWLTQEEGTFPLYRLLSADADAIFLVSTDGTIPTSPGFTASPVVVMYVYATQVCGSVPMYALSRAAKTDHWYTSELAERNELLNILATFVQSDR